MIKYIGAAAVLAAAYGINGALEVTAAALVLLALIFYTMAFRLFTGLSQAVIVKDFDILRMLTIYMIYVTMLIVVFMSPYFYVALIAAPWIAIQTFINILSILVKLDIIGIEHK
jgi:hypothetical protein